jgi:hypothetical protein
VENHVVDGRRGFMLQRSQGLQPQAKHATFLVDGRGPQPQPGRLSCCGDDRHRDRDVDPAEGDGRIFPLGTGLVLKVCEGQGPPRKAEGGIGRPRRNKKKNDKMKGF